MSAEAKNDQPAGEEAAAEEAETEQWHVSPDGENRMGPVSKQQVEQMVAEGKAGPEALCWREGFADWVPLRTVEEFSEALAAAAGPKAGDVLAEKAKSGWSAVKSAFRKSADGAARHVKKAELQMKISSIQKECNKVFLEMGRQLFEKGEQYLSEESYKAHTGKLRSLTDEIEGIREQIDELD